MLKTIDDMTEAPGAYYFGEPWPSGTCEGGERVETPLGVACFHCQTPVVVGDQGSFMGNGIDPELGRFLVQHRECGFRHVFGGIEHALGIAHATGSCESSEVTYRVSALMVWALHTGLTPVRDYDQIEAVALALSERDLPASQAGAMSLLLQMLDE